MITLFAAFWALPGAASPRPSRPDSVVVTLHSRNELGLEKDVELKLINKTFVFDGEPLSPNQAIVYHDALSVLMHLPRLALKPCAAGVYDQVIKTTRGRSSEVKRVRGCMEDRHFDDLVQAAAQLESATRGMPAR